MPETHALADVLACPRCDSPLVASDGAWACPACKVDFPQLAGIPFLFAEPGAALGEWRARVDMELKRLARECDELAAELDQDGLHALTRARLEQRGEACRDQATRLEALLQPLTDQKNQASIETYLALRTRLPVTQGLASYYNNIHRDWAWGDAENRASCEIVAGALGEPGNLLILGAGAGRLAYDLHMQADSALTAALDFNPLFLLLAQRIVRGEAVQLYEFPVAAKNLASQAVLRTLSAPVPAREGFHLVLADALRAPFAAGSFNTVVTPWLVDILPVDFRELAARINRLLRPGGRRINFGSLAFDHAEAARVYSLEETLALVTAAGFAQPSVREDCIPYMCSPASRHGRRETVVTFGATKEREAEKQARYNALPDWLVTGKEPVPLLPSFEMQAASTRIYAFVMGLIDGRQSIKDMAAHMEKQRLMSREEAEPVIRSFLIKMYDDSQRGLIR